MKWTVVLSLLLDRQKDSRLFGEMEVSVCVLPEPQLVDHVLFYFILLTLTTFGGRRTIKGGGVQFSHPPWTAILGRNLCSLQKLQNQAQTLCTCVFALGRPSVFLCVPRSRPGGCWPRTKGGISGLAVDRWNSLCSLWLESGERWLEAPAGPLALSVGLWVSCGLMWDSAAGTKSPAEAPPSLLEEKAG